MSSKLNDSKPSFPILPVIRSFLKIEKKGSNHWAVCPFHSDSEPSLSISETKNIFKCFSCGESGNPITFVMKYKKCSYVDAIKNICNILDLNAENFLSQKDNWNTKLYELNELIANSYHKYLFNASSKEYLDFLIHNRKLTLDTIKKYKIGFAPENDILSSIFQQYNKINNHKKFEQKDFDNLEIFVKKFDGQVLPFFSSRIIFPIFNENNKIIGFSGRSVRKDVEPKYLNSKSSEIFSKQDVLFNIQNLEKKKIFLYEGFFDLLQAQQAGFENGLALMGANLDTNFFSVLKKFSDSLILVFDNDLTGRNLNLKIFKSSVKFGFDIKVVNFLNSSYKDIDEFLIQNQKEAVDILSKPINFFEWFSEYFSLNKKNMNSVNVQLLVSESLEFLFFKKYDELFLFPGISIEYARKSLKIIFGFYKKYSVFEDPEYEEIILKKEQEYEKIIMKNLIQEKQGDKSLTFSSENLNEEIIDTEESNDISTYTVFKYRSILFYFIENYEKILKKYEPKNWFFDIDKEFLIFESIAKFISIFKKYLNSSSLISLDKEEQEFLNLLKDKKSHFVPVNRIENFFSEYFSFNISCLKDISKFLMHDSFLSSEEKWKKKIRIDELIKENKNISAIFFKKLFLFQKN